MRQPQSLNLPADLSALVISLNDLLVNSNRQINNVTEGNIVGFHNSSTVIPTAGAYKQGDYVKKSNPVEAGGAGNKYVILGWVCTVSGVPGTFLECRTLTGN